MALYHCFSGKDLQSSKQELKELSKKANQVKENIIQEFRMNNQTYLSEIIGFTTQNAVKDTENNLFKYIGTLFKSKLMN